MKNTPDSQPGPEMKSIGVLPTDTHATYLSTEVIDPGAETSLAHGYAPDSLLSAPPSMAMLLRAKWWIVAIFLLISSTAVPAIWLLHVPSYTTTAVIRVSPVVSRIAFNIEENGMIPLYSSYLNTQVSIIRSPAVLERVLDRADVRNTKWYNEKPSFSFGPPLSTLERLKDALSVVPRQRTELINVQITARHAEDVKVLADAVVDEYERYSDEMAREVDNKRSETLRNEKTGLHNQILALVDTKMKAAATLGGANADDYQSQLRRELSALELKYAETQRDLEMTQWDLDQFPVDDTSAAKDDKESAPDAAEDVPQDATTAVADRTEETPEARAQRYSRDPEWRQRNARLEDAEHQLSLSRQKYGESHPIIAQQVADIDYAKHLLQKREEELDQNPGNVPVLVPNSLNTTQPLQPAVVDRATVELRRDRLAREIELLGDEIKKQRVRLADVGDLARSIAAYDEEISQKTELRNRLRDRLTQLDLESRAPARISIASHAIRPSRPDKDRRIILSVFALVAALAASLGGAYLRLMLDSRIVEAKGVQQAVHIPFLGQLPPLSKRNDLQGECTNVIMMERIRMVRTSLLERLQKKDSQVVLVTSSSSQSGKTTFSFLLGRSLALLGKRTLLVEADLRRPSLLRQLHLGSSVGLNALLRGSTTDKASIVSAGVPNYDLITAGEQEGNFNPELLANGVFESCLRRWKDSYDFIILDSPPVLPVADARILSRHADGTIMVLRSAHCRRSEVAQAYSDLSAAGANLVGTVLMGATGRSRSGEYYGYETYFDNERILESTVSSHVSDDAHSA